MRVGLQGGENKFQATKPKDVSASASIVQTNSVVQKQAPKEVKPQTRQQEASNASSVESKEVITKEKLQEAVKSINEIMQTQQKASKFVFHEGLDKYYVKLVDAETEEVIKEIPPERLLNAFYEMQKLAGMIVDEKI